MKQTRSDPRNCMGVLIRPHRARLFPCPLSSLPHATPLVLDACLPAPWRCCRQGRTARCSHACLRAGGADHHEDVERALHLAHFACGGTCSRACFALCTLSALCACVVACSVIAPFLGSCSVADVLRADVHPDAGEDVRVGPPFPLTHCTLCVCAVADPKSIKEDTFFLMR